MKNLMAALYSVIAVLLIQSCKKDESLDIDMRAFVDCNNAQHLDTAQMAAKLIGTWRLKAWSCSECDEPWFHAPDKTVVARFTSARQFSVTENGAVVAQGNWNLQLITSVFYGLQSDSALSRTYGYILFCDNQVLFYDSYRDGIDNLFERVDYNRVSQ